MIFDINMGGRFTPKARYLAGGHTTDPPSSIIYYIVVSIDSIRIAFTLAALNDVEIRAADIGNACLNANFREKFGQSRGLSLAVRKVKSL